MNVRRHLLSSYKNIRQKLGVILTNTLLNSTRKSAKELLCRSLCKIVNSIVKIFSLNVLHRKY